MEQLTEVVLTCNYGHGSLDAPIPDGMTVDQLCEYLKKYINQEQDMTSFVITAVIKNR